MRLEAISVGRDPPRECETPRDASQAKCAAGRCHPGAGAHGTRSHNERFGAGPTLRVHNPTYPLTQISL